MAELKVQFDHDQLQKIVDEAVDHIKADITINILERIIKDITDLFTGDEGDAYKDGLQDCINLIDRWEKKIRKEAEDV